MRLFSQPSGRCFEGHRLAGPRTDPLVCFDGVNTVGELDNLVILDDACNAVAIRVTRIDSRTTGTTAG